MSNSRTYIMRIDGLIWLLILVAVIVTLLSQVSRQDRQHESISEAEFNKNVRDRDR